MPAVADYKRMIAKAIIFKKVQKLVRPMFPAFQANVAAYTVSILADRLGPKIDLDGIWMHQDLSMQLQEQITTWAKGVNDVLHYSAEGKMVSEWAKKPECWDAVRESIYSAPMDNIPEMR
ncbi:AIPR family protein [Nitrospirillum sp. BR 11828]|uniref:AIPR family protein n=1 Tax=Nitrospirillum sp. BR 11828 TaxID=3104325 RepID=UPI003A1034EA